MLDIHGLRASIAGSLSPGPVLLSWGCRKGPAPEWVSPAPLSGELRASLQASPPASPGARAPQRLGGMWSDDLPETWTAAEGSKETTMPTIQAQTGVITQINVFTVPEGGQRALI